MFNDIWSLGIILLNLITGRNPWKSASADDCTFQAYLKDPTHFLPTVLPISDEVNALLVRTLEVDWRHRITLREMRHAVKMVENFYSDDVLFEDSMARCPWEAGVNVDDDEEEEDSTSTGVELVQEVIPEPQPEVEQQDFLDTGKRSQWSPDSDSEMVFAARGVPRYSWDDAASYEKSGTARSDNRSLSPSPSMLSHGRFDDLRTPSGPSLYSLVSSSPSIPSPPLTPGPDEGFFDESARRPVRLTLDINGLQTDYYAANVDMLSAVSSAAMQTALDSANFDYDPYSSFYVAESEKMVTSTDDMGMAVTPVTEYDFDEDVMDELSTYSYPTVDYERYGATDNTARPESPVLGLDLGFPSTTTQNAMETSSSFNWSTIPSNPPSAMPTPDYSFLTFSPTPNSSSQVHSSHFQPVQHDSNASGTTLGSSFLSYAPATAAPSAHTRIHSRSRSRSRSRKSRLLNPVRLAFTRRSRSPIPPTQQADNQQQFVTHWTLSTSIAPDRPPSLACFASPAPSPSRTPPAGLGTSTGVQEKNTIGMRRRTTKRRLRSAKDWFSPGRLFAAVMPSP